MRILGVCGSLRSGSTNQLVLRAAEAMLPAGAALRFDPALLATLPAFNPDLDADGTAPPPPVADWRAQLRDADAVLLSSPEYAHGVPGALKNALDWLVSSGELQGKPTAVVVAGPGGGAHAREDLRRTLAVIGARLAGEVSLAVGRSQIAPDGRFTEPRIVEALAGAVAALVAAAR